MSCTHFRPIDFVIWARNKVLQTDIDGWMYGHMKFPFTTSFLEDEGSYGLS